MLPFDQSFPVCDVAEHTANRYIRLWTHVVDREPVTVLGRELAVVRNERSVNLQFRRSILSDDSEREQESRYTAEDAHEKHGRGTRKQSNSYKQTTVVTGGRPYPPHVMRRVATRHVARSL